MAQAELYLAIATVFSRFEFGLYETKLSDVHMKYAFLIPYSKRDTK